MNKQNRAGTISRQIRRWACHKLECFADYMHAYTMSSRNTERYYVELYAGCGQCLCAGTDCLIDDSPLRALAAGFARYMFLTADQESAQNLKRLAAARKGSHIEIISGNPNSVRVTGQLLDRIPRSASSFAFIDPPGYRWLRWKTIERLAVHSRDWKNHKMDMLIIFPLEMALLRNLTRPECQASITRLYGNRKWQDIRQAKLDGEAVPDNVRQQLVRLFKANLKGLGYRYVEDFKPASLSRQPFYHVIWASDDNSGASDLKAAWGKARYLPCELLYTRAKDGVDA